jgi:hypothetical protein
MSRVTMDTKRPLRSLLVFALVFDFPANFGCKPYGARVENFVCSITPSANLCSRITHESSGHVTSFEMSRLC